MFFKKNNYCIVKNSISKELANFCHDYYVLKSKVYETMVKENYISPINEDWGTNKDKQVMNAYSSYADIVMETILLKVKPVVEKNTGIKLNENYSYTRMYKKGNFLSRHLDRLSCEISTTLNLGGDIWPIFLDPTGEKAVLKYTWTDQGMVSVIKPNSQKGIKVILEPGDMLIYKGDILEHWREPLKGEYCVQVFLHYNSVNKKEAKNNKFDGRPHLGLPPYFKKDYCDV